MRFGFSWSRTVTRFLTAGLLGLMLSGGVASAQVEFPRIGISADPTHYVPEITVELGKPFTLYACIFAHNDGEDLNQPLTQVEWVLHQVCCGAVLEILNTEFKPAFTHTGTVQTIVRSTALDCVDEPGIVLATLTVSITAAGPGDYLAAAGPAGPTYDCGGETLNLMDMVVTVTATGETSPLEVMPFGTFKARYR